MREGDLSLQGWGLIELLLRALNEDHRACAFREQENDQTPFPMPQLSSPLLQHGGLLRREL